MNIGITSTLMAFWLGGAAAAAAPPTDAAVDALVDELAGRIKARQQTHMVIEVTGTIQPRREKARVATGEVLKGRLTGRQGERMEFETLDGQRLILNSPEVRVLEWAGAYQGELPGNHSHGGRTALATLALLSAGVSRHDPAVRLGLEYLRDHPMPGTYGRALRASVYAHLLHHAPDDDEGLLKKQLGRDARWLHLAIQESGGYGYITHADSGGRPGLAPTRPDSSNTQFGNLGAWIAALAGEPSPASYWPLVDRYWMQAQNTDGGWPYEARGPSTENMTIAGINSLILVLDQLHARTSGRYVRLRGIEARERSLTEIARVQAAIERGMQWLETHGRPYGEPYTQLGLERLGLASGAKYIGGRDWYREGAAGALAEKGWDGQPIEDLSMWLMFLAHGRAPVLINKLKWGDPACGWNHYHWDIYHLCRYFSLAYERLHKWQVLDTSASAEDLADAPFLFIAGQQRFELEPEFAARLRAYLDGGGTVIGHANLASEEFAESFKSAFERMFGGQRRFRTLPAEHAIFRSQYPPAQLPSLDEVPLAGLSNGSREVVLLLPVDLAGAWHRSLFEEQADLFRLMANVRFYAAGPYDMLPRRLRSSPAARPTAPNPAEPPIPGP